MKIKTRNKYKVFVGGTKREVCDDFVKECIKIFGNHFVHEEKIFRIFKVVDYNREILVSNLSNLFFIKFRSSDFKAVWIYDEEKDEYEMVVEGGRLVGMRGWN